MMEQEESIFDKRTLQDIHNEIKQVYQSDGRPWIIGYSGGKDSTTALQLVWSALSELPLEKRKKPVYVISSDTLVETPIIVDHITGTLEKINRVAAEQKMPFQAEKVRPITPETFWVNLIGKGYPAPQRGFRWCTERMKIRPADRFILDKVSAHGEVILVLGVRKSESMTRAQVMSLYEIKGSLLSRHQSLAGAFVYTPIRDFSLQDVWGYLLQVPSPWGAKNRDLLSLYQSANAGECPLVVDTTTPSCGNSRFGCWVCTVVSQDKTIEGLIDSGHDWMKPLHRIRNYLASTQDPSVKSKYREYKRRRGKVDFNRNNRKEIVYGPYTLETCKEILSMVLQAEKEIQEKKPELNIILISPEELYEIRKIWINERGDWEDSIPKMYRATKEQDLPWIKDDIGGFFGSAELKVLEDVCKKNDIPTMLVIKLITAELSAQGMRKRASIYSKIERALGEEWRSLEEILMEVRNSDSK